MTLATLLTHAENTIDRFAYTSKTSEAKTLLIQAKALAYDALTDLDDLLGVSLGDDKQPESTPARKARVHALKAIIAISGIDSSAFEQAVSE